MIEKVTIMQLYNIQRSPVVLLCLEPSLSGSNPKRPWKEPSVTHILHRHAHQ